MKRRTLLAILAAVIALAGCSSTEEGSSRPGNASDEFVAGTLIPESHYELSNQECVESLGPANVDGETQQRIRWTATGELRNTLATPSPNYGLRLWLEFDNGEIHTSRAALFFPLEAGASRTFDAFITGETRIPGLFEEGLISNPNLMVVDCGVIVEDSALNYVG